MYKKLTVAQRRSHIRTFLVFKAQMLPGYTAKERVRILDFIFEVFPKKRFS